MSTARRLLSPLAAGLAGAGILFFVDPQSGHRRRRQTAERTSALARRAVRTATRSTHRAMAEGEGLGRRALHSVMGRPRPVASEEMLADRVRSELFRDGDVPKGMLNVNVERQGLVVLRGEVPRDEQVDAIESRVREIPGVRDVENLLHRRGTPARMHR